MSSLGGDDWQSQNVEGGSGGIPPIIVIVVVLAAAAFFAWMGGLI